MAAVDNKSGSNSATSPPETERPTPHTPRSPKKKQLRGANAHAKAAKGPSSKKDSKRFRQLDKQRYGVGKSKEWGPWRQQWELYARPFLRRHERAVLVALTAVVLGMTGLWASRTLDARRAKIKLPNITDKVTLSIEVDGAWKGDVEIGLYGKDCPLTVKNFIQLALHTKGYGYKGSRFFMLTPYSMIVGGDVVRNDGSSGRAAIDEEFHGENTKLRHVVPGTVAQVEMVGDNPSQHTSQFYITFSEQPGLDGMSVVFGRVLEGMELLMKLETTPVDEQMKPLQNITISDCKLTSGTGDY